MGKNPNKWTIIIRTMPERFEVLLEALYSIVLQSYENRSVIIVLHSKEKSDLIELNKIIAKFKPFIEVKILTAPNKSTRGKLLNIALNEANARYISFLDDDDILYPYAGESLIKEMEKDGLNFACGVAYGVNQEEYDDAYKYVHRYTFYAKEFNPIELVSTNFIPIHDYIFDAKVFKDIRFDEKLYVLEDWDFLVQLIFSGKLKARFVNKPVCEYRLKNSNSQSFMQYEKRKIRLSRNAISQKYKGKEFKITFEDVFKTFPDVNNISDFDENESVIGQLRLEAEDYKDQLLAIITRRGFRAYNKALRIINRAPWKSSK